MSEQPDPIEEMESGDLRRVRRFVLFATMIITGLFATSVLLFSRHGGEFVDGLSWRVGEIVVARAVSLSESGQREAAADVYARALEAKFKNPRQRYWYYRRYAETLMNLERWGDAAGMYANAITMDNEVWYLHRRRCEALRNEGLHDQMREAARIWYEAAAEIDEQQARAAQRYLE